MSRSILRTVVLAGAMLAAQPALADDLVYRYKPSQLNTLSAYNRQPYWHLLAECAGMYGGLVAHFDSRGSAAMADRAKAQGIAYLNKATDRLSKDRGLSADEARRIAVPRVEVGRGSTEGILREPPARGLKHEQIIDLFCTQVDDAYASSLRFVTR